MTSFKERHLGPSRDETVSMLKALSHDSMEALMDNVFPNSIRWNDSLRAPEPLSESEALTALADLAARNHPGKCFIGQGYYGTITPPVIRRNVLENPAWYTAYTPYQAEISQGRLEALLNFQTCVSDLTALPVANASLLDEPTAAADDDPLPDKDQDERTPIVQPLNKPLPQE